MSLISLSLTGNTTTTYTTGNWNNSDTLQLNILSSGTVIADGAGVNVNITSLVGGGVGTSATIEAINGANVTINTGLLSASALSTYTYVVGAGSTFTVDAAAISVGLISGATVDFTGAAGTGTFIFNPGLLALNITTPPNVVNIQPGDKIEVAGSTAVTQSGNTITFTAPGLLGSTITLGSYTIPAGVTYTYNSSTSTLTFTSCFLRGTLIRTPEGDQPVEELRVGDLVVTHKGVSEIRWVGRRRIDPKAIDKPRDTLPVRIMAGAIAENVPERDLFISPDHCMFMEESLIPAKFLVNGITITQETMLDPFEYYHIELEQHSIILAEGAQTETYLDLGGRMSFLEPGVLRFGSIETSIARTWNDWCYPPVYAGAVLEKARHALTTRAEEMGYIVKDSKAS